MTDRLKGCVVTFDSLIRDDDAQCVLDAIQMIKGVCCVSEKIADSDHQIAIDKVKTDIKNQLWEIFK